ncbi:hypothetical protein HWC69_gp078 [Gordonia phage Ranch]|uniref:Uncharacterized protein n=1 Tax=Gordonia phage Ranch TaxID=2599848 RepID=A0A5J6TQU2_9CAUD|nr:hypothetical protein HWC69_gp078 [Gordonia phage Ranch]QFG12384.1 hypothetical protein PBI_RANCH_78 [Gordonia phage Ranch]
MQAYWWLHWQAAYSMVQEIPKVDILSRRQHLLVVDLFDE